ncbi:putative polysaccharide biosynthesis protein [Vibrio campbellii]|uniref:glycosyltransferase family 4 protein n=1 Tax=Vibrio campbellii TaxID=680 RepID=UPI00053137D4|nr:glycosyltransferase family 4 protein [Vibrio campbellii]KGR36768.1 putative polysaccharide biosynthesis protein [Vibrio campbellii]
MMKKIITVSTKAKGGIKSVVENYVQSGLYKEYEHHWIESHGNGGFIKNQLVFFLGMFRFIIACFHSNCIVHIHMAMGGSFYRKLMFLFLAKALSKKNIIHLHGSEFKNFYYNSGLIRKFFIEYLFTHTDRVIVLSKSWADFVGLIAPLSRVTVVNNYVNRINYIQPLTQVNNSLNILFMGVLGQRKGIYDLLNVVARLKSSGYRLKLVVGGNGETGKVKSVVKKLAIEDVVSVVGWIAGKEKNLEFSKCDVYVLPSYNEGLPMAILEAMSIGKCVISTSVGGIPEVINDKVNGFVFYPGDLNSLENILIRIINDKSIVSSVGNEAIVTYENKFSPSVILPKVEEVYNELFC